jgi:putative NADH-flavin reductase
VRKSNEADISAEDYARALLNDGERKGWLHDRRAL